LAQLGPQVSLSAQFGVNNTLFSDPDSSAEDFGFLSSFSAQLGVRLRLFDGGQARAQARQAEANIAIAESQFAGLRDQIRFEVEQAYSQLDANFENIQTTALAVQQAEEALRLARLRFQAGVGTQTDVLRSQTELTRSRFNNLRAILNYNRALAALQRAVSNLPEGFLNEVP
jgi:outer membrane protein TolC